MRCAAGARAGAGHRGRVAAVARRLGAVALPACLGCRRRSGRAPPAPVAELRGRGWSTRRARLRGRRSARERCPAAIWRLVVRGGDGTRDSVRGGGHAGGRCQLRLERTTALRQCDVRRPGSLGRPDGALCGAVRLCRCRPRGSRVVERVAGLGCLMLGATSQFLLSVGAVLLLVAVTDAGLSGAAGPCYAGSPTAGFRDEQRRPQCIGASAGPNW